MKFKILLDNEKGFLVDLIVRFKFLAKLMKLVLISYIQKLRRISSIILWIDSRYFKNLTIVRSKQYRIKITFFYSFI